MRSHKAATYASWTIFGIGAVLVLTAAYLRAQSGQGAIQVEQATRTVLDLQRAYDNARMRHEPVTQLLADGFVEIQADGRVLTRSQAIEKYTRFDDVSTGSLTERKESIADLAEDYGEDPLNIEEAVRCELQPTKAA